MGTTETGTRTHLDIRRTTSVHKEPHLGVTPSECAAPQDTEVARGPVVERSPLAMLALAYCAAIRVHETVRPVDGFAQRALLRRDSEREPSLQGALLNATGRGAPVNAIVRRCDSSCTIWTRFQAWGLRTALVFAVTSSR